VVISICWPKHSDGQQPERSDRQQPEQQLVATKKNYKQQLAYFYFHGNE
jgi:hypothetical protein